MKASRPLIIANWKLNGGIDLICRSVSTFTQSHITAQIGIAAPYLYIRDLISLSHNSSMLVGSQNISEYEEGAYTGEISGNMLKESGANFCIIGHSERRQLFNETDASCKVKVTNALNNHVLPVLCIGESEADQSAGLTKAVLGKQLHAALSGQSLANQTLCIAYEPIWAIGTGKSASAEIAQEVHAYIREELAAIFDDETAKGISILYGGSANKNNAKELLSMVDIDGLLVGGASLDPEHFATICRL